MDRRSRVGEASPITDSEPPSVQGANQIATLNPPLAQRPPRMWTAIDHDRDFLADPEHGQAQPGDHDSPPASFFQLVPPAELLPLRHLPVPWTR